ncbi:mechanosensitive ion channel family protein [Halosquirtibacter xylanolyticus]|uniref:mechanosensitive ion channel family protein n=1 Tax=Halosquirtibacter xylanolyticus TaxID=3374599 RepID=UPI00374A7DA0|nr:mechanosensitive ion channel family protein [Prolixibacteraceae bacterium]
MNYLTDLNYNYWVKVAIVIVTVYLTSFIIRKILNLFIKKKSLKANVDPTNFSFIKNSITFVIYTIGIIVIFLITPSLQGFGKALFAGAGVLAAVIGFASQKAFSNIISGIFILIFRPFRVDDIIEIGNTQKGMVEEITLRHTIIRNFENRRIVIPNSIISEETIINSDLIDQKINKFIAFGISYDSDIDLAKKIIYDEAIKHPLFIDNRSIEQKEENIPKVIVRVVELADSSVNLRASVWTRTNGDAFVLSCDLNESVKKRFDNEGIEIPFPHRTIVYK